MFSSSAHLYKALLVSAPAMAMTSRSFFNRAGTPEGQQVNPTHPQSVSIKVINQKLKLQNIKAKNLEPLVLKNIKNH